MFDPQSSGPTRNMAADAALQPAYRQERFSLTPRRLPVSFKTSTRPRTSPIPVVGLSLGRVPVLVRSSNQRPAEAGTGPDSSQWAVSDPGAFAGMGEEPLVGSTIGVDANMKGRLALLGIAVGVLGFILVQKKRGKL